MKEKEEIEVVIDIKPQDLMVIGSNNKLAHHITDVKQLIIDKIAEYNIESMKPTKENKSSLKGVLSELRKLRLAFEDHRKDIEKDILKDYNEFHAIYKKEILGEIDKGINAANERTKTIEEEEKQARISYATKYFNSKMEATPIEYANKLSYINLNYGLVATTDSKIKKAIDDHFSNIIESLVVINTQQDIPRLLAIWTTNGFNLSDALRTLAVQIEKENQFKQEEVVIPSAANVINEIPKAEPVITKKPEPVAIVEDVYDYVMALNSVTATELNEIMEFLVDKGISFDVNYADEE